jgi:hypothetical protein
MMNAIQLRNSIQIINNREKGIGEFEKRASDVLSDWINEVALQGKDLLSIKAGLPHGQWVALFGTRIEIHYEKAKRYMRVALHINQLPQLNSVGSLRQALALIAERSEGNTAEPAQRWPSHVEGITRASKFVGFIERHPFEQWPREGIQRLREQLLPIASKLWPGVKLDPS